MAYLLIVGWSTASSQWDARTVGTAGMYGVADTMPVVMDGNPAASALLSSYAIRLAVVPAPFGLTNLRRLGVAGSLPEGDWAFTLHLTSYGSGLFHDEAVRADVARRVSGSASLGLGVVAHVWRATGYPPLLQWAIVGGCVFAEGPARMGVRFRTGLGPRSREGPGLVAAMAVHAAAGTVIQGELEARTSEALASVYGLSVTLVDGVVVRIGWRDDPQVVGAGLSVAAAGVSVEYGANWHAVLGWTHAVGVGM